MELCMYMLINSNEEKCFLGYKFGDWRNFNFDELVNDNYEWWNSYLKVMRSKVDNSKDWS